MNTSFKMIDPANPVHMMSFSGARGTISQVHQLLGMRGLMSDPRGQVIDLPIRRNLREGLSLTEYIISCYGARKGVVDTAVRTSDAGYLTRRLVEVVQHIAVRKKDCETLKSIVFITSKIGEQRRLSLGMMPSRGLIGRVLADHVFWDGRCVATRNQDINDVLANHLIKASQPMLLRSPLTCKSISWICQLCYGWSLAHYDLVELGEAVGIIAGQSIGEPGTQLTLRTFHTGGVFTGDIADYVRIPFNGLTNFNEKSLCPTRTRHGHPAWLCRDDLLLLIGNSAGTQTSFIPARSLLMIRTGQYVESQQVIAEVRIKELPPKECIRKPVYPNSGGEIHWSRFFWSVRDSINNKGRVVQEASHIWILAGAISDLVGNPFFYKDQDRLSFEAYSMKRNGRQSKEIIEPKVGSATYLDLRKGIQAFGNDFVYFKNWSQCPRSNYILSHIKVARSNMEKSESLLLERRKKGFDRLHFVNIEVQLNQVLDESYVLTTDKIEKTRYCSWYRIVRRGVFSPFPISQEIYLTHGFPSFILAKNKNLTKKSTGITSGINPKIDRKKLLEVVTLIRMPSGYLYNINKQVNGFLGGNYIFLVPGKTNKIFAGIEIKNCVSLHPFLACQAKKDSLFPIISLASYDVLSNFITQLPFWGDKPKTQRCARYEILLFLCFKTCKTSQRRKLMNHLTIELIRARLLVKWEKYLHENSLEKKNYISLISVKIGNLLTTFVQVNPLVSIPTRRRVFEVNQFLKKLNNLYKYFLDQVDLSKKCSEPTLNSPNITYLTILGSSESRLTLVPSNLSRANSFFSTNSNSCEQEIMGYFRELDACDNKRDISRFLDFNCFLRDSVTLEVEKNKRVNSKFIQERPNKLGLIGTAWPIVSSSDLSNVSFVDKNLSKLCCLSYQSKRSEKIFRCFHFFDENKVILRCYLNTFGKKDLSQNSIYFSYLFILAKGINQRIVLIILGLLIGENRYLHKDRACLKSGQVIAIDQDYLVIRMGKLILTTRGANPHKISGDIIKEGDTLITLPYDRLKSGDITQGLPKVEQLLESRVIASPPIGLGDLFDRWYQNSTKLIGNAWSQLLSAGRSMEHCQLVLIDQIQKVYESQGVEICDKHLEIIVRQLTSRVVASEDGIIDVFLPGELVEFSQAERMNRVVRRLICYEPILLGMTKASLSTTSFLAEASFQETTRVLAKAALRGRIDWLKGLKENVIIGDIIPVGTGSREVACQLILNKRKESHLGNKVSKNLERDTRDFLTSHRKRRDFTPRLIVSRQFS